MRLAPICVFVKRLMRPQWLIHSQMRPPHLLFRVDRGRRSSLVALFAIFICGFVVPTGERPQPWLPLRDSRPPPECSPLPLGRGPMAHHVLALRLPSRRRSICWRALSVVLPSFLIAVSGAVVFFRPWICAHKCNLILLFFMNETLPKLCAIEVFFSLFEA